MELSSSHGGAVPDGHESNKSDADAGLVAALVAATIVAVLLAICLPAGVYVVRKQYRTLRNVKINPKDLTAIVPTSQPTPECTDAATQVSDRLPLLTRKMAAAAWVLKRQACAGA